MSKQTGGDDGGSIMLMRPDGTEYLALRLRAVVCLDLGAATIYGNYNGWTPNFTAPNSPITQLCGVRTENCPPGRPAIGFRHPAVKSAAACRCRLTLPSDRRAMFGS